MTEVRRPADERGAHSLTTQHTTSIPSVTAAAAEAEAEPPIITGGLTDDDILALIRQVPQVFHVWLNGYQTGLIEGRSTQRLDDVQLAGLAARIAVAQVENQADVRAAARRAARFIDVQMAREKTRLANLNRPDSRRFTWEPATPGGAR